MNSGQHEKKTINISVVICTYSNFRWGDFQKTIDAIDTQLDKNHEIIVICDHNPSLLETIKNKYSEIKSVPNKYKKGLSGARNTGIELAQNKIIAFIDDDAVPQQNWLQNLINHYSNQQIFGVGGKIDPNWESERPKWLPAEFDWVVGCTYLGMPERAIPVDRLIGCNMSFRKQVFVDIGGFKTNLGRIGTFPMAGEETELCLRIGERWPDAQLIYDPEITVSHLVPLQRTTFKYFLSRSFAEGLSKSIISKGIGSRVSLNTEREYSLKTLPKGFFVYLFNHEIRKAGVIGIGFMVTGIGYLLGTLTQTAKKIRNP